MNLSFNRLADREMTDFLSCTVNLSFNRLADREMTDFLSCTVNLSFHRFLKAGKCKNEPPHDETNKMTVRPAKTQVGLGIRPA